MFTNPLCICHQHIVESEYHKVFEYKRVNGNMIMYLPSNYKTFAPRKLLTVRSHFRGVGIQDLCHQHVYQSTVLKAYSPLQSIQYASLMNEKAKACKINGVNLIKKNEWMKMTKKIYVVIVLTLRTRSKQFYLVAQYPKASEIAPHYRHHHYALSKGRSRVYSPYLQCLFAH